MGKRLSTLFFKARPPAEQIEHCIQAHMAKDCLPNKDNMNTINDSNANNDIMDISNTTIDCSEPNSKNSLAITLIPPEVLYPEILDRLSTRDLLTFAATSRTFHNAIVDHPTFWRNRLFQCSLTESQRRCRIPSCDCCGGYACFRCESCHTSPLSTERYNCPVCQTYNLCGNCYRGGAHGHDLSHEFTKAPTAEEIAAMPSLDDLVKHTLTTILRPTALASITIIDLDKTNITAYAWPVVLAHCPNIEILSSRTCLLLKLQELDTALVEFHQNRPDLRRPCLRLLRAKGAKDHWNVDGVSLEQIHRVIQSLNEGAVFDVCKCSKCGNMTAMDPTSDPCRNCGDIRPICIECNRQCVYCLIRYCDDCRRVMDSLKGEFFVRTNAGNYHCQSCQQEADEEESETQIVAV